MPVIIELLEDITQYQYTKKLLLKCLLKKIFDNPSVIL